MTWASVYSETRRSCPVFSYLKYHQYENNFIHIKYVTIYTPQIYIAISTLPTSSKGSGVAGVSGIYLVSWEEGAPYTGKVVGMRLAIRICLSSRTASQSPPIFPCSSPPEGKVSSSPWTMWTPQTKLAIILYFPPPFARAGDIKTHSSVCPSVCLSVCLSVCPSDRITLTLLISSDDRSLIFGMHDPCD